jgi:hypothetical protein
VGMGKEGSAAVALAVAGLLLWSHALMMAAPGPQYSGPIRSCDRKMQIHLWGPQTLMEGSTCLWFCARGARRVHRCWRLVELR